MRRLVFALLAVTACRGSDDSVVVPPTPNAVELSDEASLIELSDLGAIATARGDRVYRQQSSSDRGTGVDGGVRLLKNGNKDLNNWICASADAELGKPLVPADIDLPSCPEPYVRGAVAARFEGSGAMTRLWMTALSMRNAPADDEVLRVYVDDELVVEQKISAVADGSAGEMFAPPFGAGSTHYVSWRYPVVFGRKLIVALDNLGMLDNVYHITDVALDRTPRPRKREAKPLSRAFASPPVGQTLAAIEKSIAAGATEEIAIPRGVVQVLSVARPDLLRDVTIRVSFEGTTTIDLPVSELFAAWEQMPSSSSLALATDGDRVSLRLPLRAPLNIALTNRGADSVAVSLRAAGAEDGQGGRLWAMRNETVAPATGVHPLLSATGAGRWVGTCALLEGHAMSGSDILVEGLNFLEGDDRAMIDGALAIPGTGTEDYFDSAFYFLGGARSSPFAAWWGVEEDPTTTPSRGRATACRWHVLNDAIDFQQSIEATLEVANNDPSLLDRYRSVAYFYK